MKTINRTFLISLLITVLITACSIEKRRYEPGYHFEWLTGKSNGTRIKRDAPVTTISPKVKADIQAAQENNFTIKEKSNYIPTKSSNNIQANKKEINLMPVQAAQSNIPHINNTSQKENSNSENKKTNHNGLFLLFGGLLTAFSFITFRKNIDKTKNVSKWARNNKWKARGALAAIKVAFAALGLYLGKKLFDSDIIFTDPVTYSLLGTGMLAALLYPAKKRSGAPGYSYARQKTHDLALSMSSFLLFACVGNQSFVQKERFPLVASIYASAESINYSFHHNSATNEYHFFSESNFSNDDKPVPAKKHSASEIIAKIILTILVIGLFVGLEILVLALTCGLACNGNEAAAWLVGLLGSALVIYITILLMRGVWRKKFSPAPATSPNRK